jgi:hypothetical protein
MPEDVGGRARGKLEAARSRSWNAAPEALVLFPADETIFCFVEGAEADVRVLSEQVGVPFERALESRRIDGTPLRKEEEGR